MGIASIGCSPSLGVIEWRMMGALVECGGILALVMTMSAWFCLELGCV